MYRRRAIVLGAVCLASYAYFYEGGGWNQNTRFDLDRAIVEQHTLRIDQYAGNTGDKAEFNGHFYADKAPGASLTALPAVAMTRSAIRTFGGRSDTPAALTALSYAATLAAAAVPAAIAALCVFWIGIDLGAEAGAAGVAALVCGLGTPLWAYATVFYGHALAAGCLMAAFLAASRLGASSSTVSRDWRVAVTLGLAGGWAVVTEYPASVPVVMIIGFAAWQVWRASSRERLVRVGAGIAAGLAVGAVILLAYNHLAFGSPFHIGYSSEQGYAGMRTGIFGVNWPKLSTASELLVGSYRGLLPLAPVLVLTPIGLWMLCRARQTRALGLTAVAVAAFYFTMTAGYVYWEGGWSVRIPASRAGPPVSVSGAGATLAACGPNRTDRARGAGLCGCGGVARGRVDHAPAARPVPGVPWPSSSGRRFATATFRSAGSRLTSTVRRLVL